MKQLTNITLAYILFYNFNLTWGFSNPSFVVRASAAGDQFNPSVSPKHLSFRNSEQWINEVQEVRSSRAKMHVPSSIENLWSQSSQVEEEMTESCREMFDWTSKYGQNQLDHLQKIMNADENIQKYIAHIFAQQKFPPQITNLVFQHTKYFLSHIKLESRLIDLQRFQVISITGTNATNLHVQIRLKKGSKMLVRKSIKYIRRNLEDQMSDNIIELEETYGLKDTELSFDFALDMCDCPDDPLGFTSRGSRIYTAFTPTDLFKFGTKIGRRIATMEKAFRHHIRMGAARRHSQKLKSKHPIEEKEEREIKSLLDRMYPKGVMKSFFWKMLNYCSRGTVNTIIDKHSWSFLGTCN